MGTRKPIVAGQFYPADRKSCLEEIEECLAGHSINKPLPKEIVAGIVPHAGWMFSGSLAALVFAAIQRRHKKVDTFVIFGAAHGYYGSKPAVDDNVFWETPLGNVAIDQVLAELLLDEKSLVRDSPAHRREHSIEVQVPFIKHLFGEAKILPIIVPPNDQAISLGESLAQIDIPADKKVVYIASTDLTHYGPRYGFVPMGAGAEGLDWAGNVNDQQFIDLALRLEAKELLASAAENCNACGAGAAAAAVAAAKKLGKTAGALLAKTNSNEVMLRKMGMPVTTVWATQR